MIKISDKREPKPNNVNTFQIGFVNREVTSNRATNTVYVGTMHYIAPEMTDGKGNYNSKVFD